MIIVSHIVCFPIEISFGSILFFKLLITIHNNVDIFWIDHLFFLLAWLTSPPTKDVVLDLFIELDIQLVAYHVADLISAHVGAALHQVIQVVY